MTEERLERIIISVSPEITKSKRSNMRRNSTVKVGASASFSTPKDEAKVVPRYLRASTSSCHDYCKYGRNHTFEAKGKHPILSAFRGDKRASNEEKVGGSELGERKKKPVMKHKVYSDKKVVSVNHILSMASPVEAPSQGEGLNKVSPKQETVVANNPVVPAFAEDRASQTEVRHQSYKSNSGEGRKKPLIKFKVSPDKKLGQFDKQKATKSTDQYESESSTISEASDSVGLQGGKDSKKSFRRSAMVHPEEADLAPHKLKFRSGKVIDLQCENNGPKRLKFRKGRSTDENANNKGDIGRRSFRRRKEVSSGGSKDPTLEAKTVVLKHQDVQEKKDMQGLLNHVIEETASKLVETRKSRVKALVGAFESVISLQESKAPLII
ncbi:hypothetical protein QJS10_CPB15g01352 [Acorus calamus]|uniref:Calmodulin-binding domain-containing protein n=1 Tax=Acorus calamus TaxID=4465 RepID=A0AAV9D3A6_ACOCL|nr:hypothetical protein QJS10_CPB15g01352 [Acorus calamus]